MKSLKNITLSVIVILAIGLFSIEMFSERGFNCYLESNFGIETNCDGFMHKSYDYSDYDECRLNMDCWQKVIDDLVNSAINDASDGVLDENYYWARKGISSAIDDLIDNDLKFQIGEYFNNKLNSIPNNLEEPIMEHFGLEWN